MNLIIAISSKQLAMFDLLKATFPWDNCDSFKSPYILVTEKNTDASFIVSHFLTYTLKQEISVCFVNMLHTMNHYKNVSMKLGLNLQQYQDSTLLHINGMDYINRKLCNNTEGNEKSNNLNDFFDTISNAIKTFNNKYLILVDDISVFLHMGIPYSEVTKLIHYLKQECFKKGKFQGCLVMKTHLTQSIHSNDDTEIDLLHLNLLKDCDVNIQCEGLETGHCKEIQGQVSI